MNGDFQNNKTKSRDAAFESTSMWLPEKTEEFRSQHSNVSLLNGLLCYCHVE